MVISERVIIHPSVAKKSASILEAIEQGRYKGSGIWFAVVTAPEPEELLYVLSSREIELPLYHKMDLKLLGLAKSREEAYEIVLELLQSGYDCGKIDTMKMFLKDY